MRYVPLPLTQDGTLPLPLTAERATLAQDGTISTCFGTRVAPSDPEPLEWSEKIFGSAWWYRWSSFTYCGVGAMLVLRPEPMYRHAQPCCAAFPFRSMGFAIFVNGLLSYMGDTYTWGRASCWKTADVCFAVTNTVLQASSPRAHSTA